MKDTKECDKEKACIWKNSKKKKCLLGDSFV